MSDLTHGLSVLGSVVRAGDDLRISFADTSSLKRGITQLKSDEASKSGLATVTFFRPRTKRKRSPRIPNLTVRNYPSGGSIGHPHTGQGLTAESPVVEGSYRPPCFEPCFLRVLDYRVNIEDTLTPLLETEQVSRIDARAVSHPESSGRVGGNFLGTVAATSVCVSKSTSVSPGAKRMNGVEMLLSVVIVTNRFSDWSLKRTREYFDWAKQVVHQVRGSNVKLERRVAYLYRKRP